MRLIVFVLCCVAAIVIAGCNHSESTNSAAPSAPASAPATSATADPLANARTIYAKECQSCHGEQGVGGVVKVDNKSLKVPSLKTERTLKHTDEQYIKQITNGGDGMPAFKDKLKPEDMEALVKLIKRDIQGR